MSSENYSQAYDTDEAERGSLRTADEGKERCSRWVEGTEQEGVDRPRAPDSDAMQRSTLAPLSKKRRRQSTGSETRSEVRL